MHLYKLSFSYVLRLPPLFRSSHLFLSETNIPAPSPLFPSSPPSSSISRLCVLFPVLLGQINFLCTENFLLGVLSQYHCFTDGALGGTKYAKLICCRQLTTHSNASHSTFQSLTYDITCTQTFIHSLPGGGLLRPYFLCFLSTVLFYRMYPGEG